MGHREILATYFDAMNHERWDEFASLWSAESLVQAVGAKARHGVDEIVQFYQGLFAPWETHLDVPTRTIFEGATAVVEVTFSGVSRQGASITFDAIDVIDFADGTIAKLTNWYDLVLVRKLLIADR
jgi:ketosteroid isomerase-like protein